ncbi:hypothetical protein STEG23_000036, partial [Scotinomys teguina]
SGVGAVSYVGENARVFWDKVQTERRAHPVEKNVQEEVMCMPSGKPGCEDSGYPMDVFHPPEPYPRSSSSTEGLRFNFGYLKFARLGGENELISRIKLKSILGAFELLLSLLSSVPMVGKVFFYGFAEYIFCAVELVFFSFFYPYYY